MNNIRRRRIKAVIEEQQKDTPDVEAALGILEDVQSEGEDTRDNTSENLQESDRYRVCDESRDFLDEALGTLDEVREYEVPSPECMKEWLTGKPTKD